jgi:hypothetical protein
MFITETGFIVVIDRLKNEDRLVRSDETHLVFEAGTLLPQFQEVSHTFMLLQTHQDGQLTEYAVVAKDPSMHRHQQVLLTGFMAELARLRERAEPMVETLTEFCSRKSKKRRPGPSGSGPRP